MDKPPIDLQRKFTKNLFSEVINFKNAVGIYNFNLNKYILDANFKINKKLNNLNVCFEIMNGVSYPVLKLEILKNWCSAKKRMYSIVMSVKHTILNCV